MVAVARDHRHRGREGPPGGVSDRKPGPQGPGRMRKGGTFHEQVLPDQQADRFVPARVP